tara:strand:- start:666 stop:3683 length:3018 start_codon:yes stop_codon:yes gene_type:complete
VENGSAQFSTKNSNVATPAEQFYVGNNLANVDLGNKRGDLKFFTGTTERLRIDDSNGNIGIGTTAPAEKLEVVGNAILDADNANLKIKAGVGGTTGALYYTFNSDSTIYGRLDLPYDTRASMGLRMKSAGGYPITIDSGNGIVFQEDGSTKAGFSNVGDFFVDTDTLFVDESTDRVGINDSTPSYSLDVNGTGRFTGVLRLDSNSAQYGGAYDIYRSGAGYLRHRIADQTLSIGVTNTSDTVYYPIVIDTPNDVLKFSHEGGEMARFDTDGNLGIGTTSPASPLSVQADAIGIRLDGTANTTRSIFYRNTTASNPAQIIADGSLRLYTEDSGTDIRFHVNSNGSTNEKMRINSSGVSIGSNLDLNNNNITEVNSITINDPGPNEGLIFGGGNGFSIYESPDDLSTNSAGNLQFVDSGSRVFTLNTSGDGDFTGNLSVDGTIKGAAGSNNGDAFLIGNDSKLVDINVANVGALYGTSTTTEGGLKLGSGGPTLYGKSGNLGIGTTSPSALLDIRGAAADDATAEMAIHGNGQMYFHGSLSADAYNGIVTAGDVGIVYTDGSQNTGSFALVPWNSSSGGIHMDSDGNVAIGGNTHTFTLEIDDDKASGQGMRIKGGGGGNTIARFERDVGASGMFVDIKCDSGDPQIRFTESSGVDWTIGVEGNVFEIVDGDALNGTSKFEINSTGDATINGDITVQGGVGSFGISDSTQGHINIYGGPSGGEGGEMRIFTNADDDSTYDYWRVDVDGSGQFRIGRAGLSDFAMNLSGQITDMPQLAQKLDITVAGTSNSSTGLEINSTGTNFESDTGMIEVTHAGSGTPTGGFFCKFNHGGSTKFSVKGNGIADCVGVNTGDLNVQTSSGGGGDADIEGTLTKGSGSFKISHPLDAKKDTHYLTHSFIEGPQADLIYRGKVTLAGGSATINIDTHSTMTEGTFVVLCRDIQSFTTNETGWTAVKSSVSGNILTIQAQDSSCTDTISWMVVGERQDPTIYTSSMTDDEGKVIVEKLK